MRIMCFGFLVIGLTGLGAAGIIENSLQAANLAYEAGDFDTAARLFEAASECADDPGLVAFNRAAVHFAKGEYREAELAYRRSLDDAEATPGRQARAWYNRGTVLLHRGGSLDVYRSAIACFDRSLALGNEDLTFAADARHNLEFAKLRWAEERQKAATKPKASSSTPEDREPPPSKRSKGSENSAEPPDVKGKRPGEPDTAKKDRRIPTPAVATENPKDSKSLLPGAGNLKALLGGELPQGLNADEMNELLSLVQNRLQRDRRSLDQAFSGRDRAGVKDW